MSVSIHIGKWENLYFSDVATKLETQEYHPIGNVNF